MSDQTREIAAEHFQVRHTITPAQWAVIERERMAQNMTAFCGASSKECLWRLFAQEAAREPRS